MLIKCIAKYGLLPRTTLSSVSSSLPSAQERSGWTMPESTTSFLFPDLNVWIALTYQGHVHHARAAAWFSVLPADSRLFFCRFTQLGFLRLLTAAAVMADEVMNQPQPWQTYGRWLQDDRVACLA